MEEKDSIKDLFQEKLSQLESPVSSELWSAVSSSITSTSVVAASTGVSILAKITIGVTIAVSITGTILFISKNEVKETPKTENKIKIEEQGQTNSPETENNELKEGTTSSNQHSNPQVNKNISAADNKENPELTIISSNLQLIEGSISYSETATQQEVKNPITPQKAVQKTINPIPKKEAVVVAEKAPEESKLQLKLPNIFTPNGDGSNDVLKLEVSNVTEFVIVVLDARSNVVFKSEDSNFNWEGTNMNGDKLPSGNYIYYVTAKDADGKAVTKYSALKITY